MPKPRLPEATPEQFEGLTLMRMTTKNLKRVRYIDLTFDRPLTIIGGEDESGKTSYIDSFGVCMSGKLAIEMQPIRNGQQEGFASCEFGDGKQVKLAVKRTLRRVGDSDFTDDVSIKIPGHIAPSQIETFLRKLTSGMAFDPHEFDNMSNEDKFEAVQKLIGKFNFKAHELARKKVATSRTEVGRDWGREQSAADSIVLAPEPPHDPDLVSAITLELSQAGQKNTERATREIRRQEATAKITALRSQVDFLPTQIAEATQRHQSTFKGIEDAAAEQVESLELQIRQLQERIEHTHQRVALAKSAMQQNIDADAARLTAESDELHAEADALQAKLDAAEPLPDVIDPAAISARLEEARVAAATYAAWEQLRDRRAEYVKKATDYGSQYNVLTQKLDAMDAEKAKAIAGAQLPVRGLGVADGYLTLDAADGSGPTPWDQASESRRADASFELAMALNPRLKIILIRSGSGISKRVRQRMQERAAEHGYRVILEVVDEGEGTTVVIEDGHVRGQVEPEVRT